MDEVWLFSGAGGRFTSGVFSEKEKAILWISENKLTGVLTNYPVDIGVYDWARERGYFVPKKEHESSSEFIQIFTCANMEHHHFENGIIEG